MENFFHKVTAFARVLHGVTVLSYECVTNSLQSIVGYHAFSYTYL